MEDRRRSPIDVVGDRLRGRRRLQLALLLAAPLGWLVVAYLGSLGVLVFNALWRFDRGAQVVVKEIGLSNFSELWHGSVYRTITIRTIGGSSFRMAAYSWLVVVASIQGRLPLTGSTLNITCRRIFSTDRGQLLRQHLRRCSTTSHSRYRRPTRPKSEVRS